MSKKKKTIKKNSTQTYMEKKTAITGILRDRKTSPEKERKKVNLSLKQFTIKNAQADPDTAATILIQNQIDYIPKISVIIPVYNVEQYLRECLDCVVNQTLKEIEIICVDDGSTDSSLEILKEYAQKDKRISIASQKNSGSGKARNFGIKSAKGKFIAFMDSDDMYPSDKTLEHLYTAAVKNKVNVCGGSLNQIKDDILITDPKQFEADYTFPKEGLIQYADYQFDYGYWRFIYNRLFLEKNDLYFPDYLRQQDPPFFVKTMATAGNFYALTEPTYVYRVSYKQISWNERKATDVVKSFIDILKDTKSHNLQKLHHIIAERLNNPLFLRAFKLLTEKDETKIFLKELVASLDYKVIYKQDPHFSLAWFYKSIPNMCKISVVIPVYNVEKYLRKCLDSVINQTYGNIEIICVNDGSTDNSPKILTEYAQKDSRIKIINRKNGGLSAARNTGIAHCNSEFVYFLDSDDYVANDSIEVLYNTLIHDNSDVSTSWIECIGDEAMVASVQEWCNKWRKNGKYKFSMNIRNDICPTAWNKIYKMSIIQKFNIRFPEGLINEDEYWLWAYMIHCESYSIVNKSLYFYLQRSNSIMGTRNNDTKIFDIIKIYNGIYENLLKMDVFYKYRDSFANCLVVASEDLITRLPIQMYALCKENIQKYKDLFLCSSKTKEIYEELEKLLTIDFIANNHFKSQPLISVIIPVYNAEENLTKCLDSIINQTLKNIEIICIDDGSKDASLDILKDYAKKDRRMAVLKQLNQRQGVARNNGIKYSTGKYIFFCDSDDWLDPNCLEKLYNKITNDDTDICVYGIQTYDNKSGVLSLDNYRDMSAYKDVIGKTGTYRDIKNALFSHFYPFNKLYKRELITDNNILFKRKIFFEDVIFSVKSMVLAKSISFLDENLYLYQDNQTSSTMGSAKNIDKSEDVFCYLQDVYNFLMIEKKYSELEKEYQDFVLQQITYHINRVHDNNIKCNFVRKTIFFIEKNKLKYQKDELDKVYQTIKSLPENNKALVIEINDCHGECLPGYIKYLQELGYNVDAIINDKQKNEKPLCVFDNLSISYASEKEILTFLNSDAMKMYKVCLFNSNIVYNHNCKSIFELFKNQNTQVKFLCVEHRLENVPMLSRKAICLVLKLFKKTHFAFEVNPHYFGNIKLHNKNRITNFIVVGNIEGHRKNYNILMNAISELTLKNIHNFKITIIGKGNVLNIPKNIRQYLDIKGRLSYPDMYSEVQKADYFLPLLDPTSKEHERYIKTGTSGSFQLIYGFKIPCVIADKFAQVHGFNDKNSIVYHDNKELAEAMLSAIQQTPFAYGKMQQELSTYAKILYQRSLDNFKSALNAKVSKRYSYFSYVFFPYYYIKTKRLKKKLLKHHANVIKERFSEYRIDIRNCGNKESDVNLIASSNTTISNITWNMNLGKGKYVQGNASSGKIIIKAINDGILKLEFRGRDQKFEGKRFPMWIDYKSIKIDGQEILSATTATWHDKPYRYEMPVKDGQEITLEIKQQPHQYLEKELEDLIFKLFPHFDYIQYNLNDVITQLKKYLLIIDEKTYNQKQLNEQISKILSILTTWRLDIKNEGFNQNFIEIMTKEAKITQPSWFTNELGIGKVLEGNLMTSIIKIRISGNGSLKLSFKGQDKRFDGEHLPVWIDYKSIKIDGKEILSIPVSVWHDKPYRYEMPVKDGQEITLEIKQQPHQYLEEELRDLIFKLYPNNEYIKDDIKVMVDKIQQTMEGYSTILLDTYPKLQQIVSSHWE